MQFRPATPTTAHLLSVALLGMRLVQLLSWPAAMITGDPAAGLRSVPLAWMIWAAAGLGALIGSAGLVRPTVVRWWWEVPVLVGTLLAGGMVTVPGYGTGYHHPSLAIAIGGLVVVAHRASPGPTVAACLAASTGYLIGIAGTLQFWPAALTSTLSAIMLLTALPVALGRGVSSWQRSLERSTAAQAQVTALLAREEERSRQYRTLHDTVLSTLSALARGTVDPTDPQVRHRITADADHLRSLIATSTSSAGMRITGELAVLARDPGLSQIRIHQHLSDLPDQLPEPVLAALSGAIREALANVRRHSGVHEAWVTAVGTATGGVVVTITDRGTGFSPAGIRGGLGVRQSILARIEEVGGRVLIDSAPDQGTTVEITWPA